MFPAAFARIYQVLHKLPVELTERYLEKTKNAIIADWNSAEKDSFYKTSLAAIAASDICVFETTHPSLTLAHFIKHSLDQDRPTIILYQENTSPFLLEETGVVGPMHCEYSNIDLEQVLRLSIRDALELPNAIRFNCLISAELNRYITQVAKAEHQSKSEFFRKLVRDHQKNNQ